MEFLKAQLKEGIHKLKRVPEVEEKVNQQTEQGTPTVAVRRSIRNIRHPQRCQQVERLCTTNEYSK
jgi:hypothetical protein